MKPAVENLAQVKRECHRLIEIVATRPGAMKLMIGVRNQLKLFSQYKANRDFSRRLSSVQQTKNRTENLDRWSD
jgi:hypothetical protein